MSGQVKTTGERLRNSVSFIGPISVRVEDGSGDNDALSCLAFLPLNRWQSLQLSIDVTGCALRSAPMLHLRV